MPSYLERIKEVALARDGVRLQKEYISELQHALDETPEAKALTKARDNLKFLQGEASAWEDEYKPAAVGGYDPDHPDGKGQIPGGKIREGTILAYAEPDAINWLIDKGFAGALKLNKREFEKLAKAAKPDFVEFVDTITFAMSRDLSEFLTTEE